MISRSKGPLWPALGDRSENGGLGISVEDIESNISSMFSSKQSPSDPAEELADKSAACATLDSVSKKVNRDVTHALQEWIS